ncbi:protein kinase [Arthrobacter sp. MSA 4-2]|uniref:protein kinase domain-containing protein n=1 Tax=Arthrobacter sp. MSA 4-2 TaxID=2794349 RepID=UPI0018E6F2E6|nr:protein kinase [Arthrobacter sp. MSA 4-2]MBJ2122122.1 protein kinase [Arthrobacter sp. MSA 4-2]
MHQRLNDPLIGELVDGRYLVESRIARGGMSTVYLALDRRLDRRVALKVLFTHLAEDRTFLDRFEQEAKSAARLSHPHVVGVLDQGIDETAERSTAYLVMEYVPGRTLRDLIRERGRLTPRLALALIDPVIEGLAAAHEAGLVHRDVKPENVLLSSNGQIKIADFGLARAVSASTGTATLVGTAAYLPPELVTGKPADARSDVYSAGIMLFELLTGRQPFTGDAPVQIAFQHAYEHVPAPSEFLPGLAEDIDELVQWCTSRDPEDRPVDGTALLGELRHVRTTLTGADLDYCPPSPVRRDDRGAGTAGSPGIGRMPDGGGTTVMLGGPAGSPTEMIGTGSPTEVIGTGSPTEVMGIGSPTEVISTGTHAGSPTEVIGEGRSGATAVPPGSADSPTAVLPTSTGSRNATTRIFPPEPQVRPAGPGGGSNATRVLGGTHRPGAGPPPAVQPRAQAHPAQIHPPQSQAPQRHPAQPALKVSRSQQRRQARAAQRPVNRLRTRRAAQWQAVLVLLLVLLAFLAVAAGWLLGISQPGGGVPVGAGLSSPAASGCEADQFLESAPATRKAISSDCM